MGCARVGHTALCKEKSQRFLGLVLNKLDKDYAQRQRGVGP
jgi:hypothetical protein